MISGMATAAKALRPDILVVGAQTERFPSMRCALDGRVPQLFEEEYRRLSAKYPTYTAADPAKVRGAYFSQTARGKYQDESKNDQEQHRAVDLILRKKAELLSKAEPIAFVF